MKKTIWLPVVSTEVEFKKGKVKVTDSWSMRERPVRDTGFGLRDDEDDDTEVES